MLVSEVAKSFSRVGRATLTTVWSRMAMIAPTRTTLAATHLYSSLRAARLGAPAPGAAGNGRSRRGTTSGRIGARTTPGLGPPSRLRHQRQHRHHGRRAGHRHHRAHDHVRPDGPGPGDRARAGVAERPGGDEGPDARSQADQGQDQERQVTAHAVHRSPLQPSSALAVGPAGGTGAPAASAGRASPGCAAGDPCWRLRSAASALARETSTCSISWVEREEAALAAALAVGWRSTPDARSAPTTCATTTIVPMPPSTASPRPVPNWVRVTVVQSPPCCSPSVHGLSNSQTPARPLMNDQDRPTIVRVVMAGTSSALVDGSYPFPPQRDLGSAVAVGGGQRRQRLQAPHEMGQGGGVHPAHPTAQHLTAPLLPA